MPLNPVFSLHVDVTNPGQFFACCGLLELAHRLCPGAEGWFGKEDVVFNVHAPADEPFTLSSLADSLVKARIAGELTAEDVRQLVEKVSIERVERALFEPWTYEDEKLSMRWDPVEDRRYALMDRDPTASDNKVKTVWMANLLAYEALVFFPCAPRNGRLQVPGWMVLHGESTFTWPLWEFPANGDTIRSLLLLPELTGDPDPSALKARGIAAVFRTRRIRVGAGANSKLNFSPSRAVM